ncbi:fungal-specific transcription factor domain-containing protein [Trametes elegans]|nr:fungal-specific transcription factor domain-containing protein [Trametes elegans]
MSSQDGPSEDRAGYFGKKRKTSQRVCDSCRRKKSDGPQMPTKKCSRCVSRGIECTFYGGNVVGTGLSRFDDILKLPYVENLETRIQRMEELFNKIGPAAELSGAFDKEKEYRAFEPMASAVNDRRSLSTAGSSAFRQSPPALRRSPGTASSSSPNSQADNEYGDPDSALTREIVQKISDLSLDPTAVRYWGKSSGFTFIQTAMGMREKFLSEMMPPAERETITPVTLVGEKLPYPVPSTEEPIALQDIPPSDLIPSLVEAYFRQANDVFPVLHEPTFRAGIADNLHLREAGFGCTVLLVCALGARYSSDARVLLDGTDLYQSAGWKWFKAVDDRHKSSLSPPDLYEVQTCILKATYLIGSSTPQMSWTHVGTGMRRAVEFGAHRNSMYSPTPTVQDELWRRAFWALVLLDWSSSYVFGRPPCIHDEDFDVALPTECDDEYWTTSDPEEAFKQPAGKPSRTTYFIEYIELTRILAHTTRTIFALEKSKAHLRNNTPEWEERVVAELDSQLNQWLDRVPQHLRWDPEREDEIFYAQSASLYTYYYQVQISVHRAFIASHRGHTFALASLIICTNAARSCVRMLEQVTQRLGDPIPRHAATLCMAGLVLTMSMWSQRRANHTAGAKRDMEYIESSIHMLGLVVRG